MFTGIIRDTGTVTMAEERPEGRRLTIHTALPPADLLLGASVACAGACLTVTGSGSITDTAQAPAQWFTVDVSAETLVRTLIGQWQAGTPVNLEPALRVGDALGGHYVTGHVDGLAEIAAVRPVGECWALTVRPPAGLLPYMAEKGSVTLDGVSLTVNAVDAETFGLMLVPHTWAVTTLHRLKPGARVHMEIDLLARYVGRLLQRNT